MKFKKIEISAFRIYDKVENATFDFSIDENSTADFVSLFAPNGYGKTSFYDAVEWGMTNNIQRFWQNKVITSGAIDALKSQSDEQVKLWRNIHSSAPTYVKILGDGIDPINRQLRPHGNKKSDADIDSADNLENRAFRNVILSQEWISAFLREIDGTKRYEIFMDNPELKDINSYYKNLKALLSYCQTSIGSIDAKIGEEQKRISELESENILEKINQQIDNLIDKFAQQGLQKLTLKTSKEEVSRLKNLVSDRLISLNEETAIREKIRWVSTAKIGSDEYIGLRTYFELESRIKVLDEEIKAIVGRLNRYQTFEIKTNEIAALSKLLEEREHSKTTISAILLQYEEYSRVHELLLNNRNKLTELRSEVSAKSDQLSTLDISETQTKADLNNALAGIEQTNATIAGLPVRASVVQKLKGEIQVLKDRINEEEELLKPLESQFRDIESEIAALEHEISEVNGGVYSKKLIEDQVLASSIDVILANRQAVSDNEGLLKGLGQRITEQQTLNSEVLAFVRQGLEIVNSDPMRSSCPLCEQTFSSHKELAERIANNNALDNLLKGLFGDKNRLEQESSKLQEEIKLATALLIRYLEDKVKDKQVARTAVSDHITTRKNTVISSGESLGIKENEVREILMGQLGLSDEEYESDLNNKLTEFRTVEESLNALLKKQAEEKKELSDFLAKSGIEMKHITDASDKLVTSEQYVAVLGWFRSIFNTEEVSLSAIQEHLAENDAAIKDYFEKIAGLRSEQESLQLELSAFNQDSEKVRLKNLQDEKQTTDARMDGFRSLLRDKLEIESQFIDYKTLAATLDLKEQGFNVALLSNKSILDEYAKIEKYADHINEFLQSENAKLILEQLALDKTFLEDNVRSVLNDEFVKTKAFLQDKVKEFFYESLINDFYRKIDPHPDFKEVHFSADFDADVPRLDVFVRDYVNKKIDLIPNLYFSTAQINILSLSIFLATALNTPGYDCIFIDDPIQSMDSVNILSTIDLLRSIVLNYDKQIILSTHDETFFNLLKKKMPVGQFKSKFLELESVGKLKNAI